jgi:hypothetical protein
VNIDRELFFCFATAATYTALDMWVSYRNRKQGKDNIGLVIDYCVGLTSNAYHTVRRCHDVLVARLLAVGSLLVRVLS